MMEEIIKRWNEGGKELRVKGTKDKRIKGKMARSKKGRNLGRYQGT